MKLPANPGGNVSGTGKISALFGSVKNLMVKHKKITAAVALVLVVAVYGTYRTTQQTDASALQNTAQAEVTRGSIEVTVTGTGTIVPVATEDIGPNVSGTVKKIYVQNGDRVKKGDLLAEVVNDSLGVEVANARLELEKAALNLKDSSTQLSDDIITAPFSGRIVNLEVKKGEEISKGAVLATLQDDSQLVFDMPVDSDTAKKVYVNQKVEVFLPDQGETVEGRVIVKNSQPVSGYSGENRVYIKVAVAARGNLSSGMKAFGTVTVGGKQVDALAVSSLQWMNETGLKATLNGEVAAIYVQEGQTVKKGQKLFALHSDTAQSEQKTQQVAYEQALLNLNDLQQQLADLKVTAPIDGIVSGMDIKEGDEIGTGSSGSTGTKTSDMQSSASSSTTGSSKTFGKIINTDQVKVSFPVDEVDIAKVKIGQVANLTVDALPDRVFKGKVTEIAEEGEVTNNVASFDVTILVDNSEKLLKSGMTANVTIVVARKDNAVLIPVEALQERGQRKFVLVPADDGSGQGRNMRPVTVGLMNESFAEITQGLQEGDKILIPGQQSDTRNARTMMPGFGGPPPGSNRNSGTRSSGSGGWH